MKAVSGFGCMVCVLILSVLTCTVAGAEVKGDLQDYRLKTATDIHARFSGKAGTFAHFGDSITVTLAFWTPLLYERKNTSPEMEQAFKEVKEYLQEECWRNWKGPKYGNEGRMTIRWAHANVDDWLNRLNPEVALIMFGTNDLNSVPLEEYRLKMRQVVRKCLDNGTVVILSTIPPRHRFAEKAAVYAEAVRRIARDMKVPLIDFHAEVLKRRPKDWDGATEEFAEYKGYDVPTLLARDGVHPSHPKQYRDDYSVKALSCSGFSLRNYLALMKYAEVIRILKRKTPTEDKGKVGKADSERGLVINPPVQAWFPRAPALGAPQGATVRVSNPEQLANALKSATPGVTILLADGVYMMRRYVEIKTDGVTLRGASGDPRRVVIDGLNSRHGELIGITACKEVTIADLTIQNIKWNGFKINSQTGVHDLTIHNCIIHNIWQRGVKGVKVPQVDRDRLAPRNCRISYCLFYNDRPKRFSDDLTDTARNFNGNYIGGIDVMFARNWTISDNVFVNIQGRTKEGRGAIFIWHEAKDCIIERNIIIDCDAGVCLGNPHRPEDVHRHCTGCVVRNNFITGAPQAGIVTVYTADCRILNNSIYEPKSRLRRGIRMVFDNDNLFIANNLLCGPDIRNESDHKFTSINNLARDLTSVLVDPQNGNLHLTDGAADAIDKAVRLADVQADIDRGARGAKPDIGADEFGP